MKESQEVQYETVPTKRKGIYKKRVINIGNKGRVEEPFTINITSGEAYDKIKERKQLENDDITIAYLGDYDTHKHGKYKDIFYYSGRFQEPKMDNGVLRSNPYWREHDEQWCPLLLNYTVIANILGRKYKLQVMKGPTFSLEDVTKNKRKKKVNSWRGTSLHGIWQEVCDTRHGMQQLYQPYKYFGFETKLIQEACINIIAQKGHSASQIVTSSNTLSKEEEKTRPEEIGKTEIAQQEGHHITIQDFIKEKYHQGALNVSHFEAPHLINILREKQRHIHLKREKLTNLIHEYHEEMMIDEPAIGGEHESPQSEESTTFETSVVIEEYGNEDTAHEPAIELPSSKLLDDDDKMTIDEDETTDDEFSSQSTTPPVETPHHAHESSASLQPTPLSQKFSASQMKTPTRSRNRLDTDSQDVQLPPSCVLSPQRQSSQNQDHYLPTQEPTQVLTTPRHMRVRSQPISIINTNNVLELFYSFPVFNIPIKQVQIAPYQDYIVLCVLTDHDLFIFRYENSGDDQFEFRVIAHIAAAENSIFKSIQFHRQLLSLWRHAKANDIDDDEMDLSMNDSSLEGDFLSFYSMHEVFELSEKSGIYFPPNEAITAYQLYQTGSNYCLITSHENGTLKTTLCDFGWRKLTRATIYDELDEDPFHTLRVVGEELYAVSSSLLVVWNIYKQHIVAISKVEAPYHLKDLVVLSTIRRTFLALTYTLPDSSDPSQSHCGLFCLYREDDHTPLDKVELRFIHQYSSQVTASNHIAKYLVCGTTNASIELFNFVSGDKVGVLFDLAAESTQTESLYPVQSITFHPCHAYMATASSRTICIYSQMIS